MDVDGDAASDVSLSDATDGDAVSDGTATDSGTTITIDTPFGPASLVSELSSPESDDDPSLTGDHLEVFFNSHREGGAGRGDVWTARRSSVGEPFSSPIPVAELNSEVDEGNVDVSRDGLTIWVARSPETDPASDLFVSSRASREEPWSTPVLVTELLSAGHDEAVGVDASLQTIVFESNRTESSELFMATRASGNGPWSTPSPIVELNTAERERQPWLGPNALFILFASNRPGGSGATDIYMASRATPAVAFGPAVEVPGINTTSQEWDPWLSDDGSTLYFSSNVSGNSEIFIAVR